MLVFHSSEHLFLLGSQVHFFSENPEIILVLTSETVPPPFTKHPKKEYQANIRQQQDDQKV
jgi:hypothetical protein